MLKVHRILIVLGFMLCALLTVQAQDLSAQYKLVRDTTGDHLVVTGSTNFQTEAITLSGVANTKSGNKVTLTIPPPTITPTVSGTTVTGATFTSTLDFGTGLTLTPDMVLLPIDITAQQTTSAGGKTISDRLLIDMGFVKGYFDNLNEIRRLNTLAKGVDVTPPNISATSVIPLDTTIIARVRSNKAVKVIASAHVRGTKAAATDPSSDELEIPSGGSVTLRIDRLKINTEYDVLVKETSAPGNRSPVELPILADSAGVSLKTLPQIPQPSVTFLTGASLKIIRNQSIEVPLSIRDAPRVRVTLQAGNANGTFVDAEPGAIYPLDSPPGVTKPAPVTLQLKQTTLDKQTPYIVKVEGLTRFEDAPPGPSITSVIFNGLDPLVTKSVDLEFTKDGINFTTKTNGVPAKIEVKVGDPPKVFTFGMAAKEDPSFLVSFADLQTAVGAGPTGDIRLPLTVGVLADDGSKRDQTFSVALKINRGDLSSKPQNAKNKIVSFVQDLRGGQSFSPGSGSSIKVGDILQTGLSLLLRFLLPIP